MKQRRWSKTDPFRGARTINWLSSPSKFVIILQVSLTKEKLKIFIKSWRIFNYFQQKVIKIFPTWNISSFFINFPSNLSHFPHLSSQFLPFTPSITAKKSVSPLTCGQNQNSSACPSACTTSDKASWRYVIWTRNTFWPSPTVMEGKFSDQIESFHSNNQKNSSSDQFSPFPGSSSAATWR